MASSGLGQDLRGTCKSLLRVPLSYGLRGDACQSGGLRRGSDCVEYECT